MSGDTSIRLDADSRPFAVDLRVPYADAHQNYSVADMWRRASTGLPPPAGLRLPVRSDGHYTLRIKKYDFLDLSMENQYSDAVIAQTGTGTGHGEDTIAAHFMFQGQWRFDSARHAAAIGPNEAYVRWNDRPWQFEVAPQTRSLILIAPMNEVRIRDGGGAFFVSQESVPVRLLLAHLKNCVELGEFGIAARNATIELFRGMIDDQVIDDGQLSSALVKAAKEYIEQRLIDDPDMNPESIAKILHVSGRTLRRAFSGEGSSVMAHVRSRRLENARRELLSTSWTVSELAARWHFADSSHFIKAYKNRFGETPAASRGGVRRAAATESADGAPSPR
jgi:AraC-like DNA-binding protein